MRKKSWLANRVSIVLLLVLLMCVLVSSKSNAAVKVMMTNTFDTYSSSGCRAITKNNNGMTMMAVTQDGKAGIIKVSKPVRAVRNNKNSWTMLPGHYYWYYIPRMKNNGEIRLYLYPPQKLEGYVTSSRAGYGWFGTGKVHFNKKAYFLSMTKIDGLRGGHYFKYTPRRK